MPTTSGLLPPPEFLSTPGQPPRPWKQWYRQFQNYVVAAAFDFPAERKRAILLHCLGAEGQRIFHTLPVVSSTETDTYEQAVRTLETHFKPTVNVVAERYRFRQRAQLPGEPVDSYISSLRELASTCEFRDFADEMIRDQLVEKTTSTKLRERLLLEKDLTLTKAITLARNMEQALREASSMCPNGKPISTAEVRKKGVQPPSSAGTKRQCYRCGSNKHLANSRDCKAVDAVCRGCNKKGHFEKMCRQRKVRAIGENLPTAAPTNHPAVSPSFNQADNEPQVLQTVNNVEHDTKVRPNVSCILNFNGADIPVVVDTASDVTLMNIDTFDLYFVREALQPCTTSITSYTSNKIPLLGYFDTNVSFQERSARIRTYVTRQGSTLVGKDVIQALQLHIDGATLTCSSTTTSNNVQNVKFFNAFPDQFSDSFGVIKGYQHKIKLKSDARPVQQKLRPLPLAAREKVSAELARLEKDGVIERVTDATEWVSPIVVAYKKSGKVRICVDLRKVNEQVVVDKHPLPNIEEMFSNLRGAKYFSKLDLKSAYHQLELHPDSRDITTFITYEGLFRYKRVCFGLASAPACFQKLMTNVLRGLCGVMCFIDDIIIYGSSKEEHYTNLCNVLKRLQECGMVLNDKCIFEAQSIQVLGHVIDQTGLHPNPDLVAAIRDAPTPTSKEQVRSFLGLAGYYARFVPNFATKVQSIRDLQTASHFAWNAEASAAFQEIKSAIVNSEALSLFDPNLDVCITTDASGYGIGAIMTQMIDGQERIVFMHFSKTQ
ncbi:hypothetical protein HOLleu_05158 [Holothuria leucospilota]|uniref:Reverse transcriptase domain-containing protein n=1 Tax=Holothuria leucospilota TaxID=206669 RepID=A0A9Q1CKL9_HOLLE|nr:hypothetical protein HOLleu_05158 [Holothuria leucospilota]